MERMRVAQESGPDAIFFFKEYPRIFRKNPGSLEVFQVDMDDEMKCSCFDGELTVLSPWVLEAGMRIPQGWRMLHYCISSSDSTKQHCYLIPIRDVNVKSVGDPV